MPCRRQDPQRCVRARHCAAADADGFVLNGRKLWITNGNEADVFIVFATLDPAAGHKGSRRCWWNAGSPGSRSEKGRQARHRASSTCELILEDCCTRDNVLGEAGQGLQSGDRDAQRGAHRDRRPDDRPAQGALDHTIRYTQERRQFGKAISDFQAVQHQIARAATDIEAARLLVYNAARLRDAGLPFLTEAAMCKLFSSEVAERVSSSP